MFQTLLSKWSLVVVAMLTLWLSGCGGPPPATTGTLTGTVTSGGEVCGDCLIAAYNPGTLRSHGGRVSENGTFELKDLPFGEYKISMVQKPTNAVVEIFDKRIPKKFRNVKSSGLSATIESEEPVTLDIEM